MNKKKLIGSLIIVFILALGITIFNVITQTEDENEQIKTIQVNEVTRSVFYAPQYVAINQGYFKENGMNIELTTGQGADAVMTAVLANQCDIGFARTRSINLCV